jgi:hypothetical protein
MQTLGYRDVSPDRRRRGQVVEAAGRGMLDAVCSDGAFEAAILLALGLLGVVLGAQAIRPA